jgi:hypothetical protein
MKTKPCTNCGSVANFSNYCAAYVCNDCGSHVGLARCYCGWAESGGNGRQELIDMGETIEPEDY